MSASQWRCFPVQLFCHGNVTLQDNGIVSVGRAQFRLNEAIHVNLDAGRRVVRPAGPGQFLVVECGNALPLLFTYEAGVWKRWVRLYYVGQWRYWFHDVVRSWGFGSPLLLLALAVYAWTIIRGLYLLLSTKSLVVLGAVVLLPVLWKFRSARRRPKFSRLMQPAEGTSRS